MAADEDTPEGAGDAKPAAERRSRERRQRQPVTIDLTAEAVATKPESAAKPDASRPAAAPVPPVTAEPPGAERTGSAPTATPGVTPGQGGATPGARASTGVETATARTPSPETSRGERGSAAPGATPGAMPGQGSAIPGARTLPRVDDTTMRNAIAGVAGGIVALVLVIILQAVGLLPAPGRSAAYEAADEARAAAEATGALERRLTAIETMVEGLPTVRGDIGNLGSRIGALEAGQANLATKGDVEGVVGALGTLRQRVDALPVPATREDVDTLAERIGRLEVTAAAGGGGSAASEAAIASLAAQLSEAETGLRTLTDRLAAAEAKVASLGNAQPMAGGEAAVRAIAITALRRAAEGSAPFATEVDVAASLGIAASDIAELRPLAATGVPTTATIAAEFPATADAILSASSAGDPNAGFLDRVVSGLGGLVSIRPAGPIAGSDPAAIVSRMEAAAEAGDLAAALAERDGLPDAGKQASAAWAAQASARVTVDTLVDRIARSLAPTSG